MSIERVLERVGPRKEEVVIDKSFFYCGRMKESDLVCLSLLVSREHCVFVNLSDGLYVTDLGSSNGVYVNGQIIRAKKQVLLSDNDCIGIGCPDLHNLDNTMFVYKVKNRVVISNNEDNICNNECAVTNASNCNNQDQLRLALREQSRLRRVNDDEIPSKIPKTTADSSEPKINNIYEADDDDDDIKIIECPSTSNSVKHKTAASNVIKAAATSTSNLPEQNIQYFNIREINADSRKQVNEKTEKSNVKMVVSTVIPDIIDITDMDEDFVHKNNNNYEAVPQLKNNVKIELIKPDEKIVVDDYNDEKLNLNIKQEPQNKTEQQDPVTTVKQEPDWGCFSQIDLVEINDDEDGIFPFSQLFERTNVKDEPADTSNDELHSSLFLDDGDDENVITILDSDNDDDDPCNINSEINIHTKIKTEPSIGNTTNIPTRIFEFNKVQSTCEDTNIVSNKTGDFDSRSQSTSVTATSHEHSNNPSLSPVPQDPLAEPSISVTATSHEHSNNCSLSPVPQDPLDEPSTSVTAASREHSNNRSLSPLPQDPLSEPSTSKKSIQDKNERKGIKLIDPKPMMPKKRKTSKTDRKDEKSTKDKISSKKHSYKKKSSSKHSERSSKEYPSKSEKHNSDKKNASSSKSNESSDLNNTDDKNKSGKHDESNKSENSRNESDKDKRNETNNNSDFNSLQNTSSASDRPRYKTTKVNAKVSKKTRNDLFCDSICSEPLRPKSRKELLKMTDESAKKDASKSAAKPDNLPSFIIPRRQIPSSLTLGKSTSVPKSLSTLPSTSCHKEMASTVLTNTTNHIDFSDHIDPSSSYNGRTTSPPSTESITNNENISSAVSQLKPLLTIPSMYNKNQKNVSFKENIADIREYQIDIGNQLKNIKCGLSRRSSREDFISTRSLNLKVEDFLARVFAWEPVWLEQQQKVKTLPPIVKTEDMQQLPNVFNNFEQYYKRIEVLLLLETWQLLLKEYECTGNRYNASVPLPCLISRHSIRTMQTPYGMRFSTLVINTLVSKNQMRLQNQPVYGDMIILEYVVKQNGKQKIRRAFAYVVKVEQQNPLRFLRIDDLLHKYVTNPDYLYTFTVQTRLIDENTVEFNQISRLRTILYMRPHLRLIQGLQFVPHSGLCSSILKVHIDEFQHEHVTTEEINEYKLITEENLNERQKEAVLKFTNISIKQEPKISLLIGPPGTGKSKVIANLVTQILYTKNVQTEGKPWRILVCAPSNAAIDEIVLRLLDIRSTIKENRFKMVRIGRIETMHEKVKNISLSELAKREAQKVQSDQQHKSLENVEYKKHQLKADIEALKSLVISNPANVVYKRDLEKYKALYEQLAHKSPEQDDAEISKLQNHARNVILQKANIIACTLSSCYTSLMESIFGCGSEAIPTCIVDEATQCCEAETLIPLILGVKNLILVGDPNQLPATVMSTEAKQLGLDRSLFTRVKEALEPQINSSSEDSKDPVILLNKQYRMVNAISHWPNKYFYKGKLLDETYYKKTFPYQPYRVLSLDGVQDDIKFSNTGEASFVGNLIHCLMTCAKINSWSKKITIGIITPYKNQKSLILSTINNQIRNVPENIRSKFITEVNTIDSFQGQERDVIVMSCVRSSGIGFLSDPQRLCVALTRAKYTLILCGNFNTFQRDNTWSDLLRDAQARGVVARLNTTARPNQIKPHVIRLG